MLLVIVYKLKCNPKLLFSRSLYHQKNLQKGQTEVDIYAFSMFSIQAWECADRRRIFVWRRGRDVQRHYRGEHQRFSSGHAASSLCRETDVHGRHINRETAATLRAKRPWRIRCAFVRAAVRIRNAGPTGRQRYEKTASPSMIGLVRRSVLLSMTFKKIGESKSNFTVRAIKIPGMNQ